MQAIEAARSFLIDRYREVVDPAFEFATNYDVDRPGWLWVDDDLNPRRAAGDHALVLDPEVGVALFLIRFRSHVDRPAGTNVRAQVARGVGLRSRLLPRRLPASQGDVRGSWRVMIYWFVDQADAASWRQQVSDLRRDTAHLDELPVDAIVDSDGDWSAAVQRHAFPRLLLKTRAVLRIDSAEALMEWSSADAHVFRALDGFGRSFSRDLERKLAGKIEALSRDRIGAAARPRVDQNANPFCLNSLSIRGFRNLRELDLHFEAVPIRCAVFHGPNGTGKSNLF